MEKRLKDRHKTLVTHISQPNTNGMNTPIDKNKTHSHHQALWRFLNNEKVIIEDIYNIDYQQYK